MTDPNIAANDAETEADGARRRIASTVDDLQDRLSPGRVLGDAAGELQERGAALLDGGARFVREHPVAISLIGLSLGALLLKRDSIGTTLRGAYDDVYGDDGYDSDDDGEPGRVRRGIDRARAAAGAARETVTERVAGARAAATDALASTRARAGDYAARSRDTLDENPLIGAAIGVAAGVLVGALLPRTEAEDRLMGDTRDGLLDRARDAARAGIDAGKAELDSVGLNLDATKSKLSEIGAQVKTAARNAGGAAADRLRAGDPTSGTA